MFGWLKRKKQYETAFAQELMQAAYVGGKRIGLNDALKYLEEKVPELIEPNDYCIMASKLFAEQISDRANSPVSEMKTFDDKLPLGLLAVTITDYVTQELDADFAMVAPVVLLSLFGRDFAPDVNNVTAIFNQTVRAGGDIQELGQAFARWASHPSDNAFSQLTVTYAQFRLTLGAIQNEEPAISTQDAAPVQKTLDTATARDFRKKTDTALEFLGKQVSGDLDFEEFCIAATAQIVRAIAERSGAPVRQTRMLQSARTAGIFSIIISKYISHNIQCGFELSSNVALIELFGKDFAPEVNNLTRVYNSLLGNTGEIEATYVALSRWVNGPSEETIEELLAAYRVCSQIDSP